MYSNKDLLLEFKVEGVECRKRLHCFTQILYAFISDERASRKKRELE
jgi:hypothetical protein